MLGRWGGWAGEELVITRSELRHMHEHKILSAMVCVVNICVVMSCGDMHDRRLCMVCTGGGGGVSEILKGRGPESACGRRDGGRFGPRHAECDGYIMVSD